MGLILRVPISQEPISQELISQKPISQERFSQERFSQEPIFKKHVFRIELAFLGIGLVSTKFKQLFTKEGKSLDKL